MKTSDSTFLDPGNKQKFKECELNIFSEVEKTKGNEKITNIRQTKKKQRNRSMIAAKGRKDKSLPMKQDGKIAEEKTHRKN